MRHRLHNRLPPWHRRTIYALTVALVVSGVGWLVAAYLLAPNGEPTPAPHRFAGPLLAAHGIVAYAALIAYALVGHTHVRTGWRVPALRSAGLLLAVSIGMVALTGVGLYYVAAERLVPILRWTHVAAGLPLPGWLALHIARGRRTTGCV